MRFFVLVSFILSGILLAADLTPPTTEMTTTQRFLFKSVPLEKIDTNNGLEKLTGFPTGSGNAADHYVRLESLFNEDRTAPDKYTIKKRSKGVNEILRAVSIKECHLSPNYYPRMTTGQSKQPDVVVFMAYTQALFDLAKELEERSDYKGAGAVYRSALIFGWHLTQEPPSLLTYILGIRIKLMAAKEYSSFLQRKLDINRSNLALDYAVFLEDALNKNMGKLNVYLGNMIGFNSLYSTIKIATEDPDFIWRQEAVMRLGIFRHGVPGSQGTIIATGKKEQQYASDTLLYIIKNTKYPTLKELAAWSVKQLTPDSFLSQKK